MLLKDYRPRAEKALQRLVVLLGSELDGQRGNGESTRLLCDLSFKAEAEVSPFLSFIVSGDPAFAINAEVFIGRVAIHLLASKTFQSDILGEDTVLGSFLFLSRPRTANSFS